MDARRRLAAGRPRNASKPHLAAADRAIALTVYRLSLWGFQLRSVGDKRGICEVVGKLALEVLKRHDGTEWRRPLGPEQVEKIYKAWRLAERARPGQRSPLQRARFTKRSLALRRPLVFPWKPEDPEEYARALLVAGGIWRPIGAHLLLETFDLEVTPKAGGGPKTG